MRILPSDAPLASAAAWTRLLDRLTLADWPDAQDHAATLRGIVALLAKGHTAAEELGAALRRRAGSSGSSVSTRRVGRAAFRKIA
jgi:hypothetical protein